MPQKNPHFGRVLREFIRDQKLTQADVADAIGVTQPSVNRWCQEEVPGRENLESLALFTGLTMDELLGTKSHKATGKITAPAGTLQATGEAATIRHDTGRFYPHHGFITPKGIRPVETPAILNGGPRKTAKQIGLPESVARARGWKPENLISYTVRGNVSQRYRDGATVWVETELDFASIPDGEDVMVRLTDGRYALKTWRASDGGAILIDVIDSDGAPLVADSSTAIIGVVRAVFG